MFIVRGLVDMGNQAANEAWALMSLRNAQTLLDLGGAATALYVAVDDVYRADIVGRRIARLTGLTSKSWMETNAQLLTALRSQTASTTMIRFFVLITVAIGVASVLVVSVLQRAKEIGILRAMGVTRGGILRVFLLQGGLMVCSPASSAVDSARRCLWTLALPTSACRRPHASALCTAAAMSESVRL